MKKTILLSSIFAVGAALATDIDSSVIGTLPVPVVAGQQLMAVPFADNDEGSIAVSDMVKTADLKPGTKLYVATSSGYDMWTLGDDGKWKAAQKVTIGNDGNAIADESKDATEATVKRGDAFWLETLDEQSGNVTLLGGKSDAATQVVPGGWNLIGNRGLVKVTVDQDSITGAATGDQIVVSKNGSLSYWTFKTGKGWRLPDGNGGWQKDVKLTLEAGQGCWLKTKNSVTVNF